MSNSVWEHVETGTSRLKVPGGWLYEVYWCDGPNHKGANLVFVPDKDKLMEGGRG